MLHFASSQTLARSPFRNFLIHHLWTPSIVKTWVRLYHGSVSNVWFWPWFRPGPCWGANSAPPEPITGFMGAYFWLNTNLSVAKNNTILSLGQTDGHCYHDSLKYTSCMENCSKFGRFILRKIIENCCHQMSHLEAKCTKSDFGWGSAPDPAGRAYSAPLDLLATSKGRRGKKKERRGREGGRGGKKGEEREGKRETGGCAPQTKILPTPLVSASSSSSSI